MCGIVGYAGNKKALNKILTGLKSLEYRGYDSAGIAYIKDDEIKIIKKEGPIKNLEENVAAAQIQLTKDEEKEIRTACEKADIAGTRYPDAVKTLLYSDSAPKNN